MIHFLYLILAYTLVDLLTGVYHMATDLGWNIPSQVRLFQQHHDAPHMEGFDWQPMVGAMPVLIAGAWWHSEFWVMAGVIGCFAQLPHLWAHEGTDSKVVKLMQELGIFISPESHAIHHGGKFNRNYCILSGWNNVWMNPLLAYLGM